MPRGIQNKSEIDPQQRVEIGSNASIHGVVAAVSHYQGQYTQIKKQTVFEFKASCQKQKGDTRKEVVKIGPEKSRGSKLLLKRS